jgi:signal transduction histidine kinase
MANRIASKIDEKDALEIEAHIQKTIAEIKDIIYGLTPPGLKLFGLSAGLQNYISMISKNHPVAIKLEALGEEIKDQQIGSMIFRIIQELITNSIKHSHCDKISIDLNVSSQLIEIIYRDNGIGFDLSNIKSGLGLSNIQSRVDSLSGQIQVESDSTGTFYSINLPFKNS